MKKLFWSILLACLCMGVLHITPLQSDFVRGSGGGGGSPTYADFGAGNSEGWVETDQGDNRIDVGTSVSNVITFTDMDQGGTDNYLVCKDNGAGNIGDFTYRGRFRATSHTNNAYPAMFMVSDTLDDCNHTTNSITAQWWAAGGKPYIVDRVGGAKDEEYGCSGTPGEGTYVYWQASRSGSSVAIRFYPTYADLLAQTNEYCGSSLNLTNSTAMQYVCGLASYASDASGFLITGTSDNFEIVSE